MNGTPRTVQDVLPPARTWPRTVLGVVLLLLLFAASVVGSQYWHAHYGVFQQHQRDTVEQLCGLVPAAAKPLASWHVPSDQGNAYFYGIAFALDDATAAQVRAEGVQAVLARAGDCVRGSRLLRHGEWRPGPPFRQVTTPLEAVRGIGVVRADHPGLRVLSARSSYDPDALARALVLPGGQALHSMAGSPYPFVYVNADRKLVLVTQYH